MGFSHEGLGDEANLNKWLDSLDQQFDQAKNIWNCLDLYFVKILLSSSTALWWLGGTFWCYSSPCRQQHISGVLLIGSLMLFDAFPSLVSNRALVTRGILVLFFTCPHTTLQIVWLGPVCCFCLAFWCFSPTCHHNNFSDLVLFGSFFRLYF